MDKPLSVWYCDVCGKKIDGAGQGYVIWKDGKELLEAYDFKVIHASKCDLKDHPNSMSLDHFLGQSGLSYLLSFFSLGPIIEARGETNKCRIINTDEFIDLFRRMQTLYYEEARKYFKHPAVVEQFIDDPAGAYWEKSLIRIIEIGERQD